jgi:hypothetical protein
MYVLFMLLVNGVAIAMVVIGAINSGRRPISNFPAKNPHLLGDFLGYKENISRIFTAD